MPIGKLGSNPMANTAESFGQQYSNIAPLAVRSLDQVLRGFQANQACQTGATSSRNSTRVMMTVPEEHQGVSSTIASPQANKVIQLRGVINRGSPRKTGKHTRSGSTSTVALTDFALS